MKKVCVAIGVLALCCGLANATPIEPAGVKEYKPVKGMTEVGPEQALAPATMTVQPVGRWLNQRTLKLHDSGFGGIRQSGTVVYDNASADPNDWQGVFSEVIGAEIGDDLHMEGGGILEDVWFSLYNGSCNGDPNDPNCVPLETIDVDLIFRDSTGDLGTVTLTLPVKDPNDPFDLGLAAGWFQTWQVTGLDDPNDPNDDLFLPYYITAIAKYYNPVPPVGVTDLGQLLVDPPTVGYSWDRFWLANFTADPNDNGWYTLTSGDPNIPDPVANFYWKIVMDKTQDPPVDIYRNTTNSTGYGSADWNGSWMGDDITITDGGTVESCEWSVIYFSWDGSPNCIKPNGPAMAGCDVEVRFGDINDPTISLGTIITDTLTWVPPITQGYGYTYTYTGLDTAGVVLTSQRNVIMTQFTNFVGGDINSQLGPFMYTNTGAPPDIGASLDRFWIDDRAAVLPPDFVTPCGGTVWGTAWLWFGGVIKADFYYAVNAINLIPFTLSAITNPEDIGYGYFEIVPTDANGTGGLGVWLPADGTLALEYDSATKVTEINCDPNQAPAGHTFLKFMLRALTGSGDDAQLDNCRNQDDFGLFWPALYGAIDMVYDNTITFKAQLDGVPVAKYIEISEYSDPNSPYLDLDGLGGADTQFTRRYDPKLDADEYPDPNGNYPYLWILITAEAAGAGEDLTKFVLTYQDDTTTDFELTGGDRNVNIRVDAFKELVAVYETTDPCPYLCGDANGDAVADIFDIDAFVLAITNPAAYDIAHPGCYNNNDCNCDGTEAAPVVDIFDIDPFVQTITGANPCDCGW